MTFLLSFYGYLDENRSIIPLILKSYVTFSVKIWHCPDFFLTKKFSIFLSFPRRKQLTSLLCVVLEASSGTTWKLGLVNRAVKLGLSWESNRWSSRGGLARFAWRRAQCSRTHPTKLQPRNHTHIRTRRGSWSGFWAWSKDSRSRWRVPVTVNPHAGEPAAARFRRPLRLQLHETASATVH